ncbi:hypothetical protein ACFL0M_07665 [Thermodesulfobacteriota bacterium]
MNHDKIPALTYGPNSADWQDRINFEGLRTQRTERMRAVMKRHNIPSLLAIGVSNTRYLTGLKGPEFVNGARGSTGGHGDSNGPGRRDNRSFSPRGDHCRTVFWELTGLPDQLEFLRKTIKKK